MKNLLILMGILALLGLTSCATTAEVKVPENYQGPIAERPTFTPGDYWVYEKADGKSVRWEFIAQEGEVLIFQNGKRKNLLYTNLDLVPVKKIHGKTKELLYERKSDDKKGFINFPLFVGKKWHYQEEVYSSALGHHTHDYHCKVEKYEQIKVGAGEIQAFQVSCRWQGRYSAGERKCPKDTGTNNYWYAPSVKNIIKEKPEEKGSNVPHSTQELVEYKVQ